MKIFNRSAALLIVLFVACATKQNGCLAQDKTQRSNEIEVFNAFPDTWPSFLEIDDEEVFDRIEALERLTAINDTVFCIKLMNLAIGASLDADAPNYFHSLLHNKMRDSKLAAVMFWALARIEKGDVMRFWQFYWSSIRHEEDGGAGNEEPYKDEFEHLKADFSDSPNAPVVKAMCTAYEYFAGGVRFASDYPYRLDRFGVSLSSQKNSQEIN